MSFSSDVKEELYSHIGHSRHCQLAELAAIIIFAGAVMRSDDGEFILCLQDDNARILRKFFTLLKKAFNINTDVHEGLDEVRSSGRIYRRICLDKEKVRDVLTATRLLDQDGGLRDFALGAGSMVTRNTCCKRAFLRDAFLCTGSISDPNKGYHLEFVCDHEGQALQLKDLITGFEIEARIVKRKKYYVLYIKEGAGIVDLLNIMEAPVSLMNLENLRIVKEMRNSINRRVNCEVANITKTV
ncbi:MAG: DNA-binding protein WhiA, partial [Butyrivibrio sp.]|nr:DNA-binding protein WhiA [Butyrivibrio sp.]